MTEVVPSSSAAGETIQAPSIFAALESPEPRYLTVRPVTESELPWWQYYYQMYHYHPPPGRKPTVFGPYLLLHTLGEGEFGKVKLGIHIESGQEVAIKLIKKDHIDSSSRMSKVEREISVLRTVRHPYIVKLYDVIETEKYIGIILQCASGGELFEYILAHRCLKERDACRLFAQLISGVHYMHQKHIVHRDLKLENLLLDRHRNIIITDFGFANQFSSAKDDLMATSCGSPCYAAPELVVSEGLYVGSAVDIWSCGVILYAMLCGYLPFDDDPANPEGDNINLLYKYILNTQLAFPDYVSADARDLLQKMLVPDPAKRCTMQTVIEHNWLRPHRDLFRKTMTELEMEATQKADLPIQPAVPSAAGIISATNSNNDDRAAQVQETSVGASEECYDAVVPEEDHHQPMEIDGQNNASSDSSMAAPETPPQCLVKGTIAATTDDSAVPEISSLELPASMHTSEFKAEHEAHVPETPEPSILQAKFLSSIHKHNSNNNNNSNNDTHQEQQQPHSVSFSTPQIPTPTHPPNKKHPPPSSILAAVAAGSPPRPSSAAQPTPSNASSNRGTRRKALSLLVNSVTDHLQAPTTSHTSGKKTMSFSRKQGSRQRSQSVLSSSGATQRYSGIKRVVTGKDRHADSAASSPPRRSMHVMPSVSEQVVMTADKEKHKSAGKKLMEWFKKKPLSTRDRSFTLHEENLHHHHQQQPPLKTMLIGKSYAVDFNDTKLRVHHGAVDQDALTSRSPTDVLIEVKQTLLAMGIEIKKDGEYKIKCVRPRRKQRPSYQEQRNQHQSSSSSKPVVSDTSTTTTTTTTTKKQRRVSGSTPFRMLLRRSPAATLLHGDTVYGDSAVDPGEEVRFSVELCKIKNLPGLYIVDIRRLRGNVWSYKFLYHTLLDTLNLSGKGGYIANNNNNKQQQQQQPRQDSSSSSSSSSASSMQRAANRHSCASSGGSSSSALEDVKEED